MPWEVIFRTFPQRIDTTRLDMQHREPAWRFLAATLWVQRRHIDTVIADAPFVSACRFVEWLEHRRRSGKKTILPPKQFIPSWNALRLYKKEGLPRCAIEARILANQSPADIAHAERISPQTALAYEDMFFDVRDRLSFHDFISGRVLEIGRAVDPSETGRIWNMFSYHGGKLVLDALMDDLRVRGVEDYRFYLQPQHDVNRTPMQRRLTLAVLVMLIERNNERAAWEFIRTEQRLARQDRLDEESVWEEMELHPHIEEAISSMFCRTAKTAVSAKRAA
jgi:hypothetical protein